MPLTETRLRALKAKDKSYKVADQRGLYVEVTPSGGKLWRFRYRIGKVEKKLSIGSYPDISLKQAREATYEARHSIASGGDPETGRAGPQGSNPDWVTSARALGKSGELSRLRC